MKQLITLFLTVAMFSNAFTQNDKQKIEGFRSFKWGQEITEMKINGELANFIKVDEGKDKDGDYYILAGDNNKIGNVELRQILYVFSKKDGKFFKVILNGKKDDAEQMNFIVDYKYGDNINEDKKDDKTIKEWIVNDVTIILREYTLHKFELVIESDWEAAEAFRKNTNVSDF